MKEVRKQMKKLQRIILYPIQGAPLTLIISFSILFILSIKAGLFGIPLSSMLSIWYFKYCFRVADLSSRGEEEAPILEYEDLFPFYELRPLKLLLITGLYAVLFYLIGGALPAMVSVAILAPAVIWALITEDSLFAAINPFRLVVYMRQVGLSYFVPVIFLVTLSYLISVSIHSGWGILVTLLIFLYTVILLFNYLGVTLNTNRDFLGYEGLSRKETWQKWDQVENERERARKVHHWYILSKASKFATAMEEIKEYLSLRGNHFEDYEFLLDEFWTWDKVHLAEALSQIYIQRILQAGMKRHALQYLKDSYLNDRDIRFEKEDTILEIAKYAREHRFFEVMIKILCDFENKHSDSSEIANVIKSKAYVMCFELHNCQGSFEYMQKMRGHFSWLQHDAEFIALVDKVGSLKDAK